MTVIKATMPVNAMRVTEPPAPGDPMQATRMEGEAPAKCVICGPVIDTDFSNTKTLYERENHAAIFEEAARQGRVVYAANAVMSLREEERQDAARDARARAARAIGDAVAAAVERGELDPAMLAGLI